jgi:hypothetical protein
MTSAQHRKWINAGLTWQLARPLVAVRNRLRSYGYTVYDIGNTGHLDHIPPEDHTPYSETGWPIKTAYGWVTAIDIMPDGARAKGLPSLQQLGARLYADRQSGRAPWIKYMNWGPDSDSHAVQDSWKPDHHRYSSSDTGHIHLSCRSDALGDTSADTYDPVALLRGQPTIDLSGDDMIIGTPDGARYLPTNAGPRLITWDEWVASGFDKTPPPVLIVKNADRVNELAPAAKQETPTVSAKLDDVTVTGTLHFDQG